MTFGSVIRILVVVCLVGPDLTMTRKTKCGGFTVRRALTGPPTTPPGQILKFRDELTNNGGWDQATGVFTAPCNGAYSFIFNAMSPQHVQYFQLAIMKNGLYQVTAYAPKDGYQTGTASALLNLNKNDVIHLQLQIGMVYELSGDTAYTSFTGFLVEEF